jgi:catechol 2,3-dioxygenase
MNVSWSHAVITVRDIDLMVKFYCDTLGFVVADRGGLPPADDGPEIAFLSGSSSDHHQIAFLSVRGPEAATSLNHSAFRVESIAEVKETIARIAADDRVADGAAVTHGNAISVYFKDPEDNGIEVFCDSPWHVKQPQGQGWDPSMSDAEVLADIEEKFRDEAEFRPMAEYQAEKAIEFGEV